MTRLLVAWAALAGTAGASALPLSTPLHRVLPEDKLVFLTTVTLHVCPELAPKRTSPLETILTAEFWAGCVARARQIPSRTEGPAGTPTLDDLETILRRLLAPHWLTLNMSEEDLRTARAGLRVEDLKPIRLLPVRGALSDPRPLEARGVFVARDLVAASAAPGSPSDEWTRTLVAWRWVYDHTPRAAATSFDLPVAASGGDPRLDDACRRFLSLIEDGDGSPTRPR